MPKVISKKKDKISKPKSKADNLRAMREEKAIVKVEKPKLIMGIFPPKSEDELKEMAIKNTERTKELIRQGQDTFIDLGTTLRENKVYELWKHISQDNGKPYRSFEHWLVTTAPTSRANAFAAVKAVNVFAPTIPMDELKTWPRYSFDLMKKVPKLKLEAADSPIRKAAKSAKSRKELVKVIKKHAPEAAVEDHESIKVDESVKSVFSEAVETFMTLHDCSEQEGIEGISSHYLNSPCEDERFQGQDLNNAQAAELVKKQRETPSQAAAD